MPKTALLPLALLLCILSACTALRRPTETTAESAQAACRSACVRDYRVCQDALATQRNDSLVPERDGAAVLFGPGATCRRALERCEDRCVVVGVQP